LEKHFQEKTNIFDVTINNIVYTINLNTMFQAQKNDNTKCRRIRRATEDVMAMSAPQSSPRTAPQEMQISHSMNLVPPTAPIENQIDEEYSNDDEQWETESGSEDDDNGEEYEATKSKAPIIVPPISISSSSFAIASQNQVTEPKPLHEVNLSPYSTTTPCASLPFDVRQRSSAKSSTFFNKMKPVMDYNIEVLNLSVGDTAVISVIFFELFVLHNVPIIAAALAIVIWILYQYYKR
jgi:WWE domain